MAKAKVKIEDYTRNVRERPVNIDVRCEDCIYFTRHAAYGGENGVPCQEFKRLEQALPCNKFSINPYRINFVKKRLPELFEIIGDLSKTEVNILAAMLIQEPKIRKLGFIAGQKVYVPTGEGKYISDWRSAYVVSVFYDYVQKKNYVVVEGKNNFRATIYASSLFTRDKWQRLKARLLKQDMIKNPKTRGSVKDSEPAKLDAKSLKAVKRTK